MKVIRKPRLTEVVGIKQLLDRAAETGDVLRRPLMELYENLRDFYTYVDEQGIGGCCALHIDMVDLAEVRSLVVRSDLRGQDIGTRLLEACLEEARNLKIGRVYALTRSEGFFARNGFVEVDKRELPHKVFNDCIQCPSFPDCDEIAMVRTLDVEDTLDHAELVPAAKLDGVLGFVGFGNMGGAIVRGLLNVGTLTPDRIVVHDIAIEKRNEAVGLGAATASSAAEAAKRSDYLVLAVKPQVMAEVLEQLKPGLRPETLLLSIAAGISTRYIQERLAAPVRVVRVMPNTPAMVRAGAAAMALSSNCTAEDEAVARTVFEAVGIVERVPEEQIDIVTALSGSGPAYFFYLVECLAQAAARAGLDEALATRLAAQTLVGAGRLLYKSGETPAILRERVTSKGGTTAAALAAFNNHGFPEVVATGLEAAAARARELGQ